MRPIRKIAAAAALVAMAAPSIAQAAQPAPCVTPAEFSALAVYALPGVISGTAEQCGTTLPAGSYLRTNGAALAQRYAASKEASWPGAKAAFLKIGGGNAEASQLFQALPDDALRPMIDGLIPTMIAQKLPANQCATIDRVVGLLAPLPPENTAELLTLLVTVAAGPRNGKPGPFAICPA